jgi:hypothetical protein
MARQLCLSEKVGFVIEYVVSDSESYFHAIGRCGDYAIHVGDEFDKIYAPAIMLRDAYPGLGEESRVNLRVERVQAYQRELEELGRGMTGTIDLCGEGLKQVVPGAVLGIPAHGEVQEPSIKEGTPQANPTV